jgi:hypothetical protein
MSTPPTLKVPTVSRLSEAGKVSLMGNAIPPAIITDAVNLRQIDEGVLNLDHVRPIIARGRVSA